MSVHGRDSRGEKQRTVNVYHRCRKQHRGVRRGSRRLRGSVTEPFWVTSRCRIRSKLKRHHMPDAPDSFVMERHGRLADMDRSFDIAYWQRLGPAAIFEAAWQLVVDAQVSGLRSMYGRRASIEVFW